jgi:hypothetical protein
MPLTFEIELNTAFFLKQELQFKSTFVRVDNKTVSEIHESHYDGHNVWILKPTSYNRGNGIHVFNTLERFD